MIKKNDILTLDIIDIGINGEGIAKHENIVIFVPFALPHEKVKVQIINTKSLSFQEMELDQKLWLKQKKYLKHWNFQ